MTTRPFLAAFGLALAILVGCSHGPPTYPVSGQVTFDGAPLPAGDILFIPTDPALAPDPGVIREGRYELRARAGAKRVEISAAKILPGGALGAGGEPVPEEYLPERYNAQSELKAEVTADGKNEFSFELSSR